MHGDLTRDKERIGDRETWIEEKWELVIIWEAKYQMNHYFSFSNLILHIKFNSNKESLNFNLLPYLHFHNQSTIIRIKSNKYQTITEPHRNLDKLLYFKSSSSQDLIQPPAGAQQVRRGRPLCWRSKSHAKYFKTYVLNFVFW